MTLSHYPDWPEISESDFNKLLETCGGYEREAYEGGIIYRFVLKQEPFAETRIDLENQLNTFHIHPKLSKSK